MNKVILVGRLTGEPNIKITQGTNPLTIAEYTLAVDRYKDGADFIRCKAFGKLAQVTEMYYHKGMRVAVSGHLQTGSYKKQDGTTVYTTDVIIESQEFAQSKNEQQEELKLQPPEKESFKMADDEELPFF